MQGRRRLMAAVLALSALLGAAVLSGQGTTIIGGVGWVLDAVGIRFDRPVGIGTTPKTGTDLALSNGTRAAPAIRIGEDANALGFYRHSADVIGVSNAGLLRHLIGPSWISIQSSGANLQLGAAADVVLYRIAAGVLGMRNGANPQTVRIYGTYTDASNYEAGTLGAAPGVVTLSGVTAGTGTDDLDILLTPVGAGAAKVGSATLGTMDVRIAYADVTCDSGAGTVTAANLIPAGATVQGVTARVTTTLAGAGLTTWGLGLAADTDRYATGKAKDAGTTVASADHATDFAPAFYKTATSVVLTAAAGQFDSGVVRVSVLYTTASAPTTGG